MHETNNACDRRTAMAALGIGGLGALATLASAQPGNARQQPNPAQMADGTGLTAQDLGWDPQRNEFVLPELPYPPDALEPFIDAQTMRLHHGTHHAGYVKGMNQAIQQLANARQSDRPNPDIVHHYTNSLSFNGSGHFNHSLFWLIMAPPAQGGGRPPTGELAEAIERDFDSFESFLTQFKTAASKVEGSGWGWLVYHPVADRLFVIQGEKQQNGTIYGTVPILGVDVWEHAHYLKYPAARGEYLDNFVKVINWARVGEFYDRARAMTYRS